MLLIGQDLGDTALQGQRVLLGTVSHFSRRKDVGKRLIPWAREEW